MSSRYPIFNFQKNQWVYFYLKKFILKNKSIKSLNDVKELSINLVDSVFRKKGFSKHNRDNWIKCAESITCSNDCRDSIGFKVDVEKTYKRSKCVPKTRKLDPKYKPISGWSMNDDEQYAYAFLKNYNSIVYTLNEYNSADIKNDEILQTLSRTAKKGTTSLADLSLVYEQYKRKEYINLTKKIESFYPEVKKRRERSTFKNIPSILQYESEFDKLAKKLKAEEEKERSRKNKTKKKSPETKTGGRKKGTRKRKKGTRKRKKYN